MKKIFVLLSVVLLTINISSQDIKSPEEFLGYKPGSQFTMHSGALDYFRYISESSPMASYITYGESYEGRELGVIFVSSPSNLEILEQIRKDNLINSGLAGGKSSGNQKPVIWLSYNVHGNESAGMEAALKTLYTLVSGSYGEAGKWLEECVIVIDPCQNPDGRDLYASRYRRSQSVAPNPNPDGWQHHEGWPSARLNHYLFDLNRDWLWQTQAETKQRLKLYRTYMPHVHADFHEMGSGSTFFFAPGADPWHEAVTKWQHEFHRLTGETNAEFFNEKSRLYYTKENFDLFCPIYGDTWPLFNGAMGFTYEQGGSGAAGLALERQSGDTLTLSERIEGHFLAALATIKVSYDNREKLISEFNDFFRSGLEKPVFEYESVIVKGNNEKSSVADMLELLDKNNINYSLSGNKGKTYKAFDYLGNKQSEVTISEGDILISSRQPQSRLVKVLFEPDSKYSDSLSYDLTAWALPYIYNIKAYAVKEKIPSAGSIPERENKLNSMPENKPYAYIADWKGFDELKFMSALLKNKIRVRSMQKPFTIDSTGFGRGSLVISRDDNSNFTGDLDKIVIETANKTGVKLHPVTTGMVQKGNDLGTDRSSLKYKPEIALVGGKGVATGSFGELWYFMERDIEYPVTVLDLDYLSSVRLSKYDVILLPSGTYTKYKEQLTGYVKDGGRLVLLENAIKLMASEESTNLHKAVEARKKEKEKDEEKLKSDDLKHLKKYEDQRREMLKNRSAGSIYRIGLDSTHPYTFGLGNEWFIVRTSSDHYPFLAEGNNIAYILNNEPVAGFAGNKFQKDVKNTIIVASERMGRGEIVYVTDSPYYRAYWKSGRILIGNILFR